MPRARKFARYVLIALGVVATAMLGWAAGILKPKHLPDVAGYDIGGFVDTHPLETFFLLLAAAVLVAVLTEVFRRRKQATQEESIEFTPQLRTELLEVLGARYEKRLEDPREQEVWLELGLEETPQALAPNPNLRLVGNRESRPVERGTSIEHIFDDAGGRLLILGEPGAGKTTMLLQLAQKLIERAEEDDTEPVPVVVNLASWARHGGTIREWLTEALPDETDVVSQDFARTLVEGNHLLLLLDGLDEVEPGKREDCIATINSYLREGPHQVVVCSRTEDYERSGGQLALEKAVNIEPLQPDQVIRELEAHPGTEGLRAMLREDDRLRELATTSLNVSVMLLAYGGEPASEVQAATKAERRRILWDDYVTRMIARRPTEYAPKNILTWLSWLAEKMQQDDMTRFIPDRMQPTWLDRSSSFKWTARLVFGLVSGLGFGLLVQGVSGPPFGLGAGLLGGLAFGAIGWVRDFPESIRLDENVNWIWSRVGANWRSKLSAGLALVLLAGLAHGLIVGLVSGLAGGLILFIDTVRVKSAVETTRSPGERLRTSRRYGLLDGLVYGLLFGLLVGPVPGQSFGLGAGFGLLAGFLSSGGGQTLRFEILRFHLWQRGAIPWRYFHFLREAADLLLLEQVGGAVEFRHLLLRDYFAELTPERIESLAARIEERSP